MYNYPVIDFYTIPQDIDYGYYTSVCKSLSAKNKLFDKVVEYFNDLPFNIIITIENMFKNLHREPLIQVDIVSVVFQVDNDIIKKMGIFDFYPVFNYVYESYHNLILRESKVLNYEAEGDELEAGIDRFSKFGRLSTIDTLAGGDILKHEDVVNLKYSRIFTKLYLESEKAKFQRELQKIKMRKYDS